MTETVLIGVLGCGRAAERLHLPALARMGDARLTAAYDPLPARRDLVARASPGCRAFASAEELLAARVVDAVIVASPPETHAETTVLALQARVPVLVEKPFATSLEDATWAADSRRLAGVPVMVGFNRRWWEPAEALRRALDAVPDDQASVETTIVNDLGAWDALAAPVDPLDDLATHHLDLLRFLLDREIASVGARRHGAQEIELQINFQGGISARCRAAFGPRSGESIAVATGHRRFAVRAGSERLRPAEGAGRRAIDVWDSAVRRLLRGRGSLTRSYEHQLRAFLACVRSGAPASPGPADGIAALHAIEAARRSLEQGGADVPVPPTPTT